MEYITIKMEQNMKEIGKMTYKRDLVWKFGRISRDMRENIQLGKKMVKVLICGVMVLNIMVLGGKIRLMDM